jgi:hypothetical protein
MPPPSKIGNSNDLKFAKVICLICKEYIGRRQQEKGKAVCKDCESIYFNSNLEGFSRRMITTEDYIMQKRKKEEIIFLNTMRKAFERLY